jgi:hypothetical protein
MKTKIFLLCLAIFLVGISSVVFGDVPRNLSYQGKLTDANGTPLDGTYSFTFKLFDVVSGGSAIWASDSQSTQVTGGLYSVTLSTVTASFDRQYWLEIVVAGETLSPRQLLTASPYTLTLTSSSVVNVSSITATNTITAPTIGTPTTFFYGDGSNLSNLGSGGGSVIDTNVRISTGYLQVQLNSVRTATATLRTDVYALQVSTGYLLTQITGSAVDAQVRISTGIMQIQLNSVGASTGALRTDVYALQASTGYLLTQITGSSIDSQVRISTGFLQVQLNSVGTSTGALRTDVYALQASTGYLQSQFATVGASTATLRADLTAVQQSTGVLTVGLTSTLPATAPVGFMFYCTDDFTVYIATETVVSANSWRKVVTTFP